ncbi:MULTISPECIES: hypothetical protein [Rhizobium/Agrobacterium group]|uniref:Uncharacterized protein n=1 Tax=Agrobacterium genomosp. 2 str. CFBP 5494 TaxID=1183436 RepID=A0A9W5AZX0_9HYPH|nr:MULTISPECIES: hypothetical protein [Rhizobium/Agrobacterium group]CAD7036290.1 hypothetical protein RP007_04436 [Rhizobium sp. P007]CUW88573.1 conserved exported hypothetical protein [Agrobacterium genomosp. 2 str. CFBP 5494]
MANFGSPTFGAAMGNAGGMMVLAAGGVGLIDALGDGLAAAAEARYQARYDDALTTAINHAGEMEGMAREAMRLLAELEAENTRLRVACRQRQEVIDVLKTRGRA